MVHLAGPAGCAAREDGGDEENPDVEQFDDGDAGDNCSAAMSGELDDESLLQLWNAFMTKYKVAQASDEALARLDATEQPKQADELKRERMLATAAAVQALTKLHHRETLEKLHAFSQQTKKGEGKLAVTPQAGILE